MAGEIKHQWNGTVLTITSDSGTSSADLKGEKGDDGARGAQGATNIISVNGEIGEVNITPNKIGAATHSEVRALESTIEKHSSRISSLMGREYIQQEGKEGGWYYRKWSNGYCELNGKINMSFNVNIPWGAVYYTQVPEQAFPFEFIEIYSANANISDNNAWCICNFNSLAHTGAAYIVSANVLEAAADIHYSVVGRWK